MKKIIVTSTSFVKLKLYIDLKRIAINRRIYFEIISWEICIDILKFM